MTTSSRIGEKLLAVRAARELRVLALPDGSAAQGWTLLGECCPRAGCATPLLRARTPGAKLYCPQHDGFVEAADGARVALRRYSAPRLTAALQPRRLRPRSRAATPPAAPQSTKTRVLAPTPRRRRSRRRRPPLRTRLLLLPRRRRQMPS